MFNVNRFMQFFEGEGGEGGGGGEGQSSGLGLSVFGDIKKGPESDRVQDAPTADPVRQTPVKVETTPVKVEATPAPVTQPLDVEALAKAFGAQLAPLMPKPQVQAQPQMTPEEAKRLLNFFEITPEFMTEFGNLDTQKGALEKLRDGLFNQVMTVFQARLQQFDGQLNERMTPMQQYLERVEGEARTGRFHESYPALKNPALEPLIMAVGESFKRSGTTFKTEQELFTALANGVEKVGQATNPNFKLASASSTPKAATNGNANPNAIPHTSVGGGGGGAGGGAVNEPVRPRGVAVFGDIVPRRK